jgi:SAM-dependent MidA family methyltransferase
MGKSQVIQPYTSRPRSLRTAFSEYGWQQGLDAFFVDHVPFSYSTSYLLANTLSRLIQDSAISRAIQSDEKQHWVELGSGSGMFSRQLLDLLSPRYPALYSQISLMITDGYPTFVSSMKQSGFFDAHQNVMQAQAIDISGPFNHCFSTPLSGIYFSYLIDSMPCTHIHIEKGIPFELQIQLSIPETAVIWETSTFPPRRLSFEDVLYRIHHQEMWTPQFIRQLSRVLEETTQRVQLEQTELCPQDQDFLRSFSQLYPDQSFLFNYPLTLHHFFNQLSQVCSPDTWVVMQDFGCLTPENSQMPDDLRRHYGMITCYPVFFPLIQAVAQSYGFIHSQRTLTPQEESSQLCIYSKKPLPESLSKVLDTHTQLFSQLHATHRMLDETPPFDSSDGLLSFFNTQPDDIRYDYQFIYKLMRICAEHHWNDTAVFLFTQATPIHQQMALPLMELLLRNQLQNGETDPIEATFKRIKLVPNSQTGDFLMGLFYLSTQKYDQALPLLLNTVAQETVLNGYTLYLIAETAYRLQNTVLCEVAVRFILECNSLYPGLLDSQVIQNTQTLQQILATYNKDLGEKS